MQKIFVDKNKKNKYNYHEDKMNTWNNYYERAPFAEGVASAFDLCGNNSSFVNPSSNLPENQFIKHSMGVHFQDVAKYIRQTMNYYDGIHKNKKL